MPRRTYWVVLLALPLEAGYVMLYLLRDLGGRVPEYVALFLAMSLLYLVGCWRAAESERGGKKGDLALILLAGLVFRLTLLPLYPSLTDDPYRYRWEGKLQAAGGNPYRERPESARRATLRDEAWGRVNGKDLPTAYGPLLEWSYRLTYAAVSRVEPDPVRQVRLFKIPYAVLDLCVAAMLVGLLGRLGLAKERVLIYFWSPLAVIEFWASGHNDPMLLLFLVGAVWAAVADRWGWAMGALWGATLTKFWPALLFPLFLVSGGVKRLPARAAAALAWTPLVALVSWPYLQGGGELRGMLLGFLGGWRNNASVYNWIYAWAGQDYERGKLVVAVLVALAALVVALLRPPIVQGVLWLTVTLLFLSANCFSWYLTWLLPLLAVIPNAALLLWTALVALSYHVLIWYRASGQWLETSSFLYLEYVPVYGMLLATAAARLVARGSKSDASQAKDKRSASADGG